MLLRREFMKIKDGFILRKFSDKIVAVADDDFADKSNIFIKMNSSAEFVWNFLSQDRTYEEVVDALLEKYDIDRKTAENDLDEFLSAVKNAGLLDEQS